MQPSVHIGVRCFFLCLLAVGIAMLAGAGCADVRQSLREEYGEPDVIGEESGDLVRYYPPDDPPPPEYRWPASRTTTT